jgi:hypothetical protein
VPLARAVTPAEAIRHCCRGSGTSNDGGILESKRKPTETGRRARNIQRLRRKKIIRENATTFNSVRKAIEGK